MLKSAPQEAYEHFRKITPKDTGYARRRTRLRKSEIQARYDYAIFLENGHSRQAPDGMVEPTAAYMKKWLRKRFRRVKR